MTRMIIEITDLLFIVNTKQFGAILVWH